jgi:hypothetical protein
MPWEPEVASEGSEASHQVLGETLLVAHGKLISPEIAVVRFVVGEQMVADLQNTVTDSHAGSLCLGSA